MNPSEFSKRKKNRKDVDFIVNNNLSRLEECGFRDGVHGNMCNYLLIGLMVLGVSIIVTRRTWDYTCNALHGGSF